MAKKKKSDKATGKAAGKKVVKVVKAGRQTVEPKPKGKGKGYRGIVAGTKKEQVAKLYDEKGSEVAFEKGSELGLTSGTLKSWIGAWKREGKSKPQSKAA